MTIPVSAANPIDLAFEPPQVEREVLPGVSPDPSNVMPFGKLFDVWAEITATCAPKIVHARKGRIRFLGFMLFEGWQEIVSAAYQTDGNFSSMHQFGTDLRFLAAHTAVWPVLGLLTKMGAPELCDFMHFVA